MCTNVDVDIGPLSLRSKQKVQAARQRSVLMLLRLLGAKGSQVRFSAPDTTYRRLSSRVDRRLEVSTRLLIRLPCLPSHRIMADPTCNTFLGSSPSTNKSWNIEYDAVLDSSPSSNNSWNMMKEILQGGVLISKPKVIYCMLNSRYKHAHNEELHSLFGKKSIPRIKIHDDYGFFSKK
ncbi:hypothetical protein M8C21_013371 [Ambrosia artemisiifolia]|uniref:Uncharacterized protein n=1 Tax=Ambrosia artemisiifolia TaxID=4212 RepID=A0AAD5CXD8_AMBAR|nr:hypothetical protein M8C21_013371 [Ambrosia artemisiifolia]